MIVKDTDIESLKIIDIEPISDNRGFFARSFCRDEFRKNNLQYEIVQCNISQNIHKGTLRGLHYQLPPHEEVKMIRCVQGTIFDVIIDLRKDSATYLQWRGFELRADNHRMLYVPKGCAHGYLTLEDYTTVSYMVTASYHPECERAVRWNDPIINIKWPGPATIISEKDSNHPDVVP
jgi:dTDP-4-dehydrorhamnose 3,5-epimerase